MKKFLTFLTASLLLVLFALPVGAASRAELSSSAILRKRGWEVL